MHGNSTGPQSRWVTLGVVKKGSSGLCWASASSSIMKILDCMSFHIRASRVRDPPLKRTRHSHPYITHTQRVKLRYIHTRP